MWKAVLSSSLLVMSLLPMQAQASTASANFNVTITIVRECTLTAPATISFGNVGSSALITTLLQQSQAFTVTCSAGTPYTVGFTSGNDLVPGSVTHQMKSAVSSNTAAVQYTLADATVGATNPLPLGGPASVITAIGTGAAQTRTLQATLLTPSLVIAPDTYSDTVTMAVTY